MLQTTAVKYDLEVQPEGLVALRVPFPAGARVTVFVIEEPADRFDDLLAATTSSLEFRDNPYDDEDWNHA